MPSERPDPTTFIDENVPVAWQDDLHRCKFGSARDFARVGFLIDQAEKRLKLIAYGTIILWLAYWSWLSAGEGFFDDPLPFILLPFLVIATYLGKRKLQNRISALKAALHLCKQQKLQDMSPQDQRFFSYDIDREVEFLSESSLRRLIP